MLKPVFLLTLFTAVIHIQTAVEDRNVRSSIYSHLIWIIPSSYRVHLFSEPGTCDGSLSHWAHILNDSSIFSNISFGERNVKGVLALLSETLKKEREREFVNCKQQKNVPAWSVLTERKKQYWNAFEILCIVRRAKYLYLSPLIHYHSKVLGQYDFFGKQLILLFSKDALNWSKVTEKTIFQKISISNKY